MSEFILCETAIPQGLSIIEASAGTGKTWTLGHLLPRLIIDSRIATVDQALMVSFTEDSTRELAERVRKYVNELADLLKAQDPRPSANPDLPALIARAASAAGKGQEGLKMLLEHLGKKDPGSLPQLVRNLLRAQLDCDRLTVCTIHALCQRVLSEEGFLCGTPSGFEVLPDISELKLEALRDTWRARLASNPSLAGLAVSGGWTLEQDLKAWNLLEPLDTMVLHGDPKPLDGLLKGMRAALGQMKAHSADLKALEGILGSLASPNKKADELDPQAWTKVLKGLDPDGMDSHVLELAAWLAKAEDCARKNGAKNVDARQKINDLPLVQAAALVTDSVHGLEWSWRKEALTEARARFQERLRKANALSFNDLIARLHTALQGPAGEQIAQRLRKRWKVALVDESQDTDPRQLAIFEKIFNLPAEMEQSLVLIGDPKQSIYGFRGADLEAYESARDRQPRVQLSDLTRTQRSAQGLVEALNSLFSLPDPLGSPKQRLIQAQPVKSDADLPLPDKETARLIAAVVQEQDFPQWQSSIRRTRNSAQAAAQAVAKLLGKKAGDQGVQAGQCAVLTRSNFQAQAVREALAALGVPAVVRDDGDVLSSDEAADLALILRAALKPASQGYRFAALATRMLGFSAADLLALDEKQEQDWQLRFSAWGEAWRRRGIAALMAAMDEGGTVSLALASDPLGERRLTDLRHLAEILQAEEADRRLAPDRLLEWMRSAMAKAEEGTAPPARLQRLEQDGSAVQVLTIHRAKGLEFDYVFCPFLWYIRVPKSADMRVAKLHGIRGLADPEFLDPEDKAALDADSGWQALEEELRLAYVALTRAKRRVWFLAGYIGYSGNQSNVPPSALDWILREVRPDEDREAWYRRMAIQKKPLTKSDAKRVEPWTCEHELRLQVLAKDPRIALEPVSLQGAGYTPPEAQWSGLRPSPAPELDLKVWRITSYSGLLRGQGPDRDVHDRMRVPELPTNQGPDVPLADFAKGAEAGECLHQLLEAWDFQGLEPGLAQKVLERNGLAKGTKTLKDPVGAVGAFLPDLAGALIPDLGSLKDTAKLRELSEWHFVLPLSEQGLDGRSLAEVFATHPDARMREYAATLQSLAPEAVKGMLQGYIDRLVRLDLRWAVVDWKSNHLGSKAADYSPDALWACAAEDHYILQVHLYLTALRRYLRHRGGGHHVHGAALAFLRGMRKGSSEGILFFRADEAFMARLEALFLGLRP
jgi:exodeoxyribonuclease V beta subunit